VIEVSFVIPCLNEELTIKNVIRRCHEVGSLLESYEIIVADNMSNDNSALIAKKENAKVLKVSKKGYGSALIKGIEFAEGEFIVMGDADDTYDFMDAIKMIKILKETHCDLVIGNRFEGGIAKGSMPFLHRYLGNPILSAIGRILYLIQINDFHCGIRAFKRQSILDLELNSFGMEFASEMIIRSSLANYKIRQTPVSLRNSFSGRVPHIKTWRDGWRHLKFLLNFSPKYSYFPVSVFFILLALILITLYIKSFYPFEGANTLLFSVVFYNFSLWSFSEYLTCRLLISKKIKYKTNFLSEYLFSLISQYEYLDKAYQLMAVLIFAFIGQSIFMFQRFTANSNFLASKLGNFCAFNLMILSTTIIFLYLTSSKLGTIYWLNKNNKN